MNEIRLNRTILKNVVTLWDNYLETDFKSEFDRWLQLEFKKHPEYGKQDRFNYSELLFSCFRFFYPSLFLHYLSEIHFIADSEPENVAVAMKEFAAMYDTPEKLKTRLRAGITEELFFLVCLRLKEEKLLNSDYEPLFSDNFKKEKYLNLFDSIKDMSGSSESLGIVVLWNGIPLFYMQQISARIKASDFDSDQSRAFLMRQVKKPPVWLRIYKKIKLAEASQKLREEGFENHLSENAVLLKSKKSIINSNLYKEGLIEVQDLASQKIAGEMEISKGQFIWDVCSGAGGKTLQLAEATGNAGRVCATDIREHMLSELQTRSKRAGFSNICCSRWNGTGIPQFIKEGQFLKGFDRILVDAPCTGSGTWRRRPDAKLKLKEFSLLNITKLQFMLLQNVAIFLKPGGILVYSTCSFFCEENEEVVASFLEKTKGFELLDQKILGNPSFDSDTLFIAKFKK